MKNKISSNTFAEIIMTGEDCRHKKTRTGCRRLRAPWLQIRLVNEEFFLHTLTLTED